MGIKKKQVSFFYYLSFSRKKIPPKKNLSTILLYKLLYMYYYVFLLLSKLKIPSFKYYGSTPCVCNNRNPQKMGDIPCILFLHDLIFYILYNQTCYNLKTERENILIYLSKKIHICKLCMCIASTMTNYLFEITQACK